jgi:tetratricopeptide (TPR) repeat protein
MFRQDRSPEALLARPMPERYRLAGALVKRVLAGTKVVRTERAGDSARAESFMQSLSGPLDDPSDIEALDDAIERCIDAITADPEYVPALATAGRALMLYGFINLWQWHPRPLRDSLRMLSRALDLDPSNADTRFVTLLCNLYSRRFEQAGDMLDAIKDSPRHECEHAYGRGVWFGLHDNWRLAESWLRQAIEAAGDDPERARRCADARLLLADVLARQGKHEAADACMAESVLGSEPHRYRLHLWSVLKHARRHYHEAWELNRRSLTFGTFDVGQHWRHELLVYFRRLNFVPKGEFSLAEEKAAGVDGPFRYVGSERVETGDADDHVDDDEEFVPAFRANLFLEGENLPVVSEIADPAASFEGRAKLRVRALEPRTLEKRPLQPGERFKPGQYIMTDEQAGTVFHVLLLKRHNLHNPYLDLPESARNAFDFDREAMQRFENAPWDVRLMLADHGFDPLRGALAACKLVDAFLRFGGGIGVDLETGMAVRGGDWRNEGPQDFDIRKHVVIGARELPGGKYWLRTWGLCKFRRPELEVMQVPHELVEPVRQLLLDACEQAAQGALYREGDHVGDFRQPLLLAPSRQVLEDAANREVLELLDATASGEPAATGAEIGIRALLPSQRPQQ